MKKVKIKTNPDKLKSLVIGDKVFRSAYDYSLTAEDVEQARRELKETEEVRNASLRTLKEMLARDEFNYRLDEDYLLRFLRTRKFNCKEAYEMIRYVYTMSKHYPDIFDTLPSDLESVLERVHAIYLPYRDEGGSILVVERLGLWEPSKESIYSLFQKFRPVADIFTTNPSCQINRIVVLVDFKGFTLKHLTAALNPSVLPFWSRIWLNFYTWRIKYIFLVNTNKLAYTILNAVRHLMKKKIANRVIIIGSMTQLHQYLNPAILPKEYGGSLDGSVCSISQHIIDNLSYLEYDQSFRRSEES